MLKYLPFFIIPALGYFSLVSEGIASLSLIIFSFVFLPLVELILPANQKILSTAQVGKLQNNGIYSLLLYSVVPIQYFLLYIFLSQSVHLEGLSFVINILTMGVLCGTLGINVAHELGHRKLFTEQLLAQALLLTSLYQHFFIEHNRGHHKRVATPEDPASARFNENLYQFLFRCIPSSFYSAWHLEANRLKSSGLQSFTIQNLLIRFIILEISFLSIILYFFGISGMIAFVLAAILGFVLLESIDYIEHYGLSRKQIKPGIYEQVAAHHSWNCNKLLGRLMLFELPLHPAHHKNSSIKYQALQSTPNAPEMPAGYPGMILLALFPIVWFRVMNNKIPKVID